MVENEAGVRRIEIKSRLGKELTSDELKAINPEDKTVKGIGRKKTLKDNITKFKEFSNE